MITIAILIGLILFAFLLPAKYDPAMRLKDWTEHKEKETP
jgi:hypothetical protein